MKSEPVATTAAAKQAPAAPARMITTGPGPLIAFGVVANGHLGAFSVRWFEEHTQLNEPVLRSGFFKLKRDPVQIATATRRSLRQRAPGGDRRKRRELLAVQRRATDQGAVHVLLRDDVADVLGIHRAAVEHPHGVGDLG